MSDSPISPMPVIAALELLAEAFADRQIVVTNQGSSRIWPKLRCRSLDFHYNPSTMGGAIPLALGLALAQPEWEVLVVSGDGSLLMNLGALVTVAASRATNLTIALLDNGQYEVTGGQKTAGSIARVDYVALARASGIRSAVDYRNIDQLRANTTRILSMAGPRFIHLVVGGATVEELSGATPPMSEQLLALRASLKKDAVR